LLLLLVGGVGSLTVIFLQGRQDRAGPVPEEAGAEEEAAVGGRVEDAVGEALQLRAEEFESTLEREGVEIFRIRGAQTSSDDQGNVILKQVEVDYPRGEDHYSLRADGASYNEDTRATRLEGSVALEGTNGLELDTDWLELADGGMVLTAADDSRFSFEGMTARGDGLRMDFREEIVRLGGGVRIDGAEPQDTETGEAAAAPQSLSLAAETLIHLTAGGADIRVVAPRGEHARIGERGHVACNPGKLHIFDAAGRRLER